MYAMTARLLIILISLFLYQEEPSPKLNRTRNEKFHKLFKNVPDEEVVLKCKYLVSRYLVFI